MTHTATHAGLLALSLSLTVASAQPLSGTLTLDNGRKITVSNIEFQAHESPSSWFRWESNTRSPSNMPVSTAEFFWEEISWGVIQRIDVVKARAGEIRVDIVLLDGCKKSGSIARSYLVGTEIIAAKKVVLGSSGDWTIPVYKVVSAARQQGPPTADQAFVIEDDSGERHSVRNAGFATEQGYQPERRGRYALGFRISGAEIYPGDGKILSVTQTKGRMYDIVMKSGETASGQYIGKATHVFGAGDGGNFYVPFDKVKKIEFQ